MTEKPAGYLKFTFHVSPLRLDKIREQVEDRISFKIVDNEIRPDLGKLDKEISNALRDNPSLLDRIEKVRQWLIGWHTADRSVPPDVRMALKEKLKEEFAEAASPLPFPVEELDRQRPGAKHRVVMTSPVELGGRGLYERIAIYKKWLSVRHAVVTAGADVTIIPESSKGGLREVYTRDRFVLIGNIAYLPDSKFVPETDTKDYRGEISQIRKVLEDQGVKTIIVKGAWFEGGNVIRHFRSRTLFLGIENSTAEDADKLIAAVNATQKENWNMVQVPLTNYSVMYHMDTGMSEELPNGEVLISRRLTDKETFRKIRDIVGAENIIELSKDEAYKLATNLTPIGKTLVLTGTLPKLKEKLEERGYRVVMPSDYKQTTFEFGAGGVHCMTNELPKL